MTTTPNQSTPRASAIEILSLWATTNNSIDLLFHAAIEHLADIDRGLVKTLVYGVLRQKEYLDHIIRSFSKHPLAQDETAHSDDAPDRCLSVVVFEPYS